MTLDEFRKDVERYGVDGSEEPIVLALVDVAKAAREFAKCDSMEGQRTLNSALAALDKELEG